jgi:hypothetical protein
MRLDVRMSVEWPTISRVLTPRAYNRERAAAITQLGHQTVLAVDPPRSRPARAGISCYVW